MWADSRVGYLDFYDVKGIRSAFRAMGRLGGALGSTIGSVRERAGEARAAAGRIGSGAARARRIGRGIGEAAEGTRGVGRRLGAAQEASQGLFRDSRGRLRVASGFFQISERTGDRIVAGRYAIPDAPVQRVRQGVIDVSRATGIRRVEEHVYVPGDKLDTSDMEWLLHLQREDLQHLGPDTPLSEGTIAELRDFRDALGGLLLRDDLLRLGPLEDEDFAESPDLIADLPDLSRLVPEVPEKAVPEEAVPEKVLLPAKDVATLEVAAQNPHLSFGKRAAAKIALALDKAVANPFLGPLVLLFSDGEDLSDLWRSPDPELQAILHSRGINLPEKKPKVPKQPRVPKEKTRPWSALPDDEWLGILHRGELGPSNRSKFVQALLQWEQETLEKYRALIGDTDSSHDADKIFNDMEAYADSNWRTVELDRALRTLQHVLAPMSRFRKDAHRKGYPQEPTEDEWHAWAVGATSGNPPNFEAAPTVFNIILRKAKLNPDDTIRLAPRKDVVLDPADTPEVITDTSITPKEARPTVSRPTTHAVPGVTEPEVTEATPASTEKVPAAEVPKVSMAHGERAVSPSPSKEARLLPWAGTPVSVEEREDGKYRITIDGKVYEIVDTSDKAQFVYANTGLLLVRDAYGDADPTRPTDNGLRYILHVQPDSEDPSKLLWTCIAVGQEGHPKYERFLAQWGETHEGLTPEEKARKFSEDVTRLANFRNAMNRSLAGAASFEATRKAAPRKEGRPGETEYSEVVWIPGSRAGGPPDYTPVSDLLDEDGKPVPRVGRWEHHGAQTVEPRDRGLVIPQQATSSPAGWLWKDREKAPERLTPEGDWAWSEKKNDYKWTMPVTARDADGKPVPPDDDNIWGVQTIDGEERWVLLEGKEKVEDVDVPKMEETTVEGPGRGYLTPDEPPKPGEGVSVGGVDVTGYRDRKSNRIVDVTINGEHYAVIRQDTTNGILVVKGPKDSVFVVHPRLTRDGKVQWVVLDAIHEKDLSGLWHPYAESWSDPNDAMTKAWRRRYLNMRLASVKGKKEPALVVANTDELVGQLEVARPADMLPAIRKVEGMGYLRRPSKRPGIPPHESASAGEWVEVTHEGEQWLQWQRYDGMIEQTLPDGWYDAVVREGDDLLSAESGIPPQGESFITGRWVPYHSAVPTDRHPLVWQRYDGQRPDADGGIQRGRIDEIAGSHNHALLRVATKDDDPALFELPKRPGSEERYGPVDGSWSLVHEETASGMRLYAWFPHSRQEQERVEGVQAGVVERKAKLPPLSQRAMEEMALDSPLSSPGPLMFVPPERRHLYVGEDGKHSVVRVSMSHPNWRVRGWSPVVAGYMWLEKNDKGEEKWHVSGREGTAFGSRKEAREWLRAHPVIDESELIALFDRDPSLTREECLQRGQQALAEAEAHPKNSNRYRELQAEGLAWLDQAARFDEQGADHIALNARQVAAFQDAVGLNGAIDLDPELGAIIAAVFPTDLGDFELVDGVARGCYQRAREEKVVKRLRRKHKAKEKEKLPGQIVADTPYTPKPADSEHQAAGTIFHEMADFLTEHHLDTDTKGLLLVYRALFDPELSDQYREELKAKVMAAAAERDPTMSAAARRALEEEFDRHFDAPRPTARGGTWSLREYLKVVLSSWEPGSPKHGAALGKVQKACENWAALPIYWRRRPVLSEYDCEKEGFTSFDVPFITADGEKVAVPLRGKIDRVMLDLVGFDDDGNPIYDIVIGDQKVAKQSAHTEASYAPQMFGYTMVMRHLIQQPEWWDAMEQRHGRLGLSEDDFKRLREQALGGKVKVRHEWMFLAHPDSAMHKFDDPEEATFKASEHLFADYQRQILRGRRAGHWEARTYLPEYGFGKSCAEGCPAAKIGKCGQYCKTEAPEDYVPLGTPDFAAGYIPDRQLFAGEGVTPEVMEGLAKSIVLQREEEARQILLASFSDIPADKLDDRLDSVQLQLNGRGTSAETTRLRRALYDYERIVEARRRPGPLVWHAVLETLSGDTENSPREQFHQRYQRRLPQQPHSDIETGQIADRIVDEALAEAGQIVGEAMADAPADLGDASDLKPRMKKRKGWRERSLRHLVQFARGEPDREGRGAGFGLTFYHRGNRYYLAEDPVVQVPTQDNPYWILRVFKPRVEDKEDRQTISIRDGETVLVPKRDSYAPEYIQQRALKKPDEDRPPRPKKERGRLPAKGPKRISTPERPLFRAKVMVEATPEGRRMASEEERLALLIDARDPTSVMALGRGNRPGRRLIAYTYGSTPERARMAAAEAARKYLMHPGTDDPATLPDLELRIKIAEAELNADLLALGRLQGRVSPESLRKIADESLERFRQRVQEARTEATQYSIAMQQIRRGQIQEREVGLIYDEILDRPLDVMTGRGTGTARVYAGAIIEVAEVREGDWDTRPDGEPEERLVPAAPSGMWEDDIPADVLWASRKAVNRYYRRRQRAKDRTTRYTGSTRGMRPIHEIREPDEETRRVLRERGTARLRKLLKNAGVVPRGQSIPLPKYLRIPFVGSATGDDAVYSARQQRLAGLIGERRGEVMEGITRLTDGRFTPALYGANPEDLRRAVVEWMNGPQEIVNYWEGRLVDAEGVPTVPTLRPRSMQEFLEVQDKINAYLEWFKKVRLADARLAGREGTMTPDEVKQVEAELEEAKAYAKLWALRMRPSRVTRARDKNGRLIDASPDRTLRRGEMQIDQEMAIAASVRLSELMRPAEDFNPRNPAHWKAVVSAGDLSPENQERLADAIVDWEARRLDKIRHDLTGKLHNSPDEVAQASPTELLKMLQTAQTEAEATLAQIREFLDSHPDITSDLEQDKWPEAAKKDWEAWVAANHDTLTELLGQDVTGLNLSKLSALLRAANEGSETAAGRRLRSDAEQSLRLLEALQKFRTEHPKATAQERYEWVLAHFDELESQPKELYSILKAAGFDVKTQDTLWDAENGTLRPPLPRSRLLVGTQQLVGNLPEGLPVDMPEEDRAELASLIADFVAIQHAYHQGIPGLALDEMDRMQARRILERMQSEGPTIERIDPIDVPDNPRNLSGYLAPAGFRRPKRDVGPRERNDPQIMGTLKRVRQRRGEVIDYWRQRLHGVDLAPRDSSQYRIVAEQIDDYLRDAVISGELTPDELLEARRMAAAWTLYGRILDQTDVPNIDGKEHMLGWNSLYDMLEGRHSGFFDLVERELAGFGDPEEVYLPEAWVHPVEEEEALGIDAQTLRRIIVTEHTAGKGPSLEDVTAGVQKRRKEVRDGLIDLLFGDNPGSLGQVVRERIASQGGTWIPALLPGAPTAPSTDREREVRRAAVTDVQISAEAERFLDELTAFLNSGRVSERVTEQRHRLNAPLQRALQQIRRARPEALPGEEEKHVLIRGQTTGEGKELDAVVADSLFTLLDDIDEARREHAALALAEDPLEGLRRMPATRRSALLRAIDDKASLPKETVPRRTRAADFSTFLNASPFGQPITANDDVDIMQLSREAAERFRARLTLKRRALDAYFAHLTQETDATKRHQPAFLAAIDVAIAHRGNRPADKARRDLWVILSRNDEDDILERINDLTPEQQREILGVEPATLPRAGTPIAASRPPEQVRIVPIDQIGVPAIAQWRVMPLRWKSRTPVDDEGKPYTVGYGVVMINNRGEVLVQVGDYGTRLPVAEPHSEAEHPVDVALRAAGEAGYPTEAIADFLPDPADPTRLMPYDNPIRRTRTGLFVATVPSTFEPQEGEGFVWIPLDDLIGKQPRRRMSSGSEQTAVESLREWTIQTTEAQDARGGVYSPLEERLAGTAVAERAFPSRSPHSFTEIRAIDREFRDEDSPRYQEAEAALPEIRTAGAAVLEQIELGTIDTPAPTSSAVPETDSEAYEQVAELSRLSAKREEIEQRLRRLSSRQAEERADLERQRKELIAEVNRLFERQSARLSETHSDIAAVRSEGNKAVQGFLLESLARSRRTGTPKVDVSSDRDEDVALAREVLSRYFPQEMADLFASKFGKLIVTSGAASRGRFDDRVPGEARISGRVTKKTLVHEIAHGVETADPRLVALQRAFILSRLRSGELPQSLEDALSKGYAVDELFYEDTLPGPEAFYSFSIYEDGMHAELFSTVLGWIFGPESSQIFVNGKFNPNNPYVDRETLEFVLGLWFGFLAKK